MTNKPEIAQNEPSQPSTFTESIHRARELFNAKPRYNKTLDRALSMFAESYRKYPEEPRIQTIYNRSHEIHANFRSRQKEVADLEERCEYSEALAKLNRLADEGFADFYDGSVIHPIADYRRRLETKHHEQTGERQNGTSASYLSKAREDLKREEFNSALATLKECSDSAEVTELRNRIVRKRKEKIDELLGFVDDSIKREEWQDAQDLADRARSLDPSDEAAKIVARRITHLAESHRVEREIGEMRREAERNLREARSLEQIESAIFGFEELLARMPSDEGLAAQLKRANDKRAAYLQGQGMVATLAQAENYEKALEEINNLIAQGMLDYKTDHGTRPITDVKAELERKAETFAEQKAGKQIALAEEVITQNPALALQYANKGLALPFVPQSRKEELENLAIRAEQLEKSQAEASQRIREGLQALNEQSDYKAALSIFEEVLAAFPHLEHVAQHLQRAKTGLHREKLQEARELVARAAPLLIKKDLGKLRETLRQAHHALDLIGNDDEGRDLRARCQALEQQRFAIESLDAEMEEARPRLANAIEKGHLNEAQELFNRLSPQVQKMPEFLEWRGRLIEKQETQDALAQIEAVFRQGEIAQSLEDIQKLIARAPKERAVLRLAREIEANALMETGRLAYRNGDFDQAREALLKVPPLHDAFKAEVNEYLGQIEQKAIIESRAREVHEEAQSRRLKGDLEGANRLLKNFPNEHSSQKKKIDELKLKVEEEYRLQLIGWTEQALEKKDYVRAHEVADKLREVHTSADVNLFHQIGREYAIHQAEIATRKGDWEEAFGFWQEAEKLAFDDPRVEKGARKVRRWHAIAQADMATSSQDRAEILEEAFDPKQVDVEIDSRLLDAWLASGQYARALTLASSRANARTKFAKRCKSAKKLYQKLEDARDCQEKKAYKRSIDILTNCIKEHPEFEELLAELLRDSRNQVTQALLDEVREMESRNETVVNTIPIYREIIKIDKYNKDVEDLLSEANGKFDLFLDEILNRSIKIYDEENATLEEVESRLLDLRAAQAIANEKQKIKLKPQIEKLSKKSSNLKAVEAKLEILKNVLTEAQETGEFEQVERMLGETMNLASHHNLKLTQMKREIQKMKDRRQEVRALVEKIRDAFDAGELQKLEGLVLDFEKLDRHDDFGFRRKELLLRDPVSGEPIRFSDLRSWSRKQRENREQVLEWVNDYRIDEAPFIEEEKLLRAKVDKDFDNEALGEGLGMLSIRIRNQTDRIPEPPMAVGRETRESVRQLDKQKSRLERKADDLENEAKKLLERENKLKGLIKKAGTLIDEGDFAKAKVLVKEGLAMAPFDGNLKFFLTLIEEKE